MAAIATPANAQPATAYYGGATDASWNTASNWFTTSAGTTAASGVPGSNTDVHFYTTNANPGNLSTTLGVPFSIQTLTVHSSDLGESSAVSIGPGTSGTLTITPTDSTTGITVLASSVALTITPPVTFGANQTWTNNSNWAASVTMRVSGQISGTGSLTINGNGGISLSNNSNNYSGGTIINGFVTPERQQRLWRQYGHLEQRRRLGRL